MTEVIIFPKNEHFLINLSSNEVARLSPYFDEVDSIKVVNSSTMKAKGMNTTSLELLTFDSSKDRKIGVYLKKGNSGRSSLKIQISTNIFLNFEEQVNIMNEFNLIVKKYRKLSITSMHTNAMTNLKALNFFFLLRRNTALIQME